MFDIRIDINDYRKDSMDRFGDDLTEEILQYMTFANKVRLECVSKQWKRCVFQKQYVIELCELVNERPNTMNSVFRLIDNERPLDFKSLESLLKKCPNIIIVYVRIKVELSLIGQYCHHLKSLDLTMTGEEDLEFFRNYGHKLEELVINESNDKIEDFLKLCPNLKKFGLQEQSVLFKEDKEFLPKLEYISPVFMIGSGNDHIMKILSDKYSKTMKSLLLWCEGLNEEEVKICVERISRFHNLRQLELTFHLTNTTEPIDGCLSLIGQKCNKLLKLDFRIDESLPITDRFFDVFHHFKTIKRLRILIFTNTVLSGNIECFKHCKQLYELSIIYLNLTEDFFKNIESFVPKLQSLEICRKSQFSDAFIGSFRCVKSLQNIHHINIYDINRTYLSKYWYFGKSLSKVMLTPKGKDVMRVNDNCAYI